MSVTLVWAHPNESASRQASGGLRWVMNQQKQIKERGLHTIVSQSVFSPDDAWDSSIEEELGGRGIGKLYWIFDPWSFARCWGLCCGSGQAERGDVTISRELARCMKWWRQKRQDRGECRGESGADFTLLERPHAKCSEVCIAGDLSTRN
jgi:hypothetical protein